MNDLNVNGFLKVFNEVWSEAVAISNFSESAQDIDAMKAFIFGDKGVISKVAEKIASDDLIQMTKNSHSFDLVFTSTNKAYIEDATYPIGVKALVKYANDDDIINSAWLLAHWRSPLKVLIFQDWIGSGDTWVNTKLSNIFNFLDSVDDFNVESEMTEYLFLAAFREYGDEVPKWYWSSSHQRDLRVLTSEGALDRAQAIATMKGKYGVNCPQRIDYSFELHQSYEDTISMHGELFRKLNRVVVLINHDYKQLDLAIKNPSISISNVNYCMKNNGGNMDEINFRGPFKFEGKNSIFNEISDAVNGIYLWCVKNDDNLFRVYYVGESDDIKRRMGEHLSNQLSGKYTGHDIESLKKNIRVLIHKARDGILPEFSDIDRATFNQEFADNLNLFYSPLPVTGDNNTDKSLRCRYESGIVRHIENQGQNILTVGHIRSTKGEKIIVSLSSGKHRIESISDERIEI